MSGVTPAVSVLLPTYQRSLWLRQAVDSVLAQRFEDFELIVVDDGSTDGTEEALTIADKRLRYHRQAHGGASSAQNTALSLARAPIVALLNSDDLWRPNHLATVCDALDRFPEAVLAVTRRWPTDKSHLWAREGALVDLLPRLVVTNPLGQPSSVAARRPIALEVGGFDERLLVSGDFDFFLRIAMRGPFCLVRRNTSVKRRGPNSLVEWGLRSDAYLESRERILRRAIAALPPHRKDADQLTERARAALALDAAIRAVREQDADAARAALREACARLPELSSDPTIVLARVAFLAPGRANRAAHLVGLAAAWPDPGAESALVVRGYAALLVAQERRIRHAAALIRAGHPGPRLRLRALRGVARLVVRGVMEVASGRIAGARSAAPPEQLPPRDGPDAAAAPLG